MAGSMAFTYDSGVDGSGRAHGFRKVIVTWTSDASGDCTGVTQKLVGTLVKASTNPSATAPTDNYDITLADDDGVNILTACDADLQNRDTANSEEVYFLVKDHTAGTALAQSIHPVVCSPLTVTIATSGNAKSGVLNLFLRD